MQEFDYFDINPHHRVATKKSGPTVDSFLKKIQQQMGVAIIGFAAYRDDDGKLCTFEYVIHSYYFNYKLRFTQLLYQG